MTLIELVAAAFGIACVVLYVRQNVWSWPTGLVQVVLYVYVFYEARLYSDVGLHVVYVVLQIYGWWYWTRGDRDRDPDEVLPVTDLSWRGRAAWTLAILAGTAALGGATSTWTDAALPYPDAFTTVASLVAQWLLARKVRETWILWIAVDLVAIPVYLARALYATAGLYAVFLVLAVCGLVAWTRNRPAASSSASSSRRTGATSTS